MSVLNLIRTRWRPGSMVFLLALGLALLVPSPASAHADLASTYPSADEVADQAPESLTLNFDDSVNGSLGGVSVFGPDGKRKDRGRVESGSEGRVLRVPVDVGDRGTYTVSWRVTSDDGHPLSGSYLFHVGERTGSGVTSASGDSFFLKAAGVAARWLAYAGSLLAVGTLSFSLLVARGPTPAQRRLRYLLIAGTASAAAGSAALLLVEVMRSSGRDALSSLALIPDAVGSTRFAKLEALRAGMSFYALTGWFLLRGKLRASPALYAASLATVMALLIPSIAGHAWTASPMAVAIASDAVHLMAVAIWTGGLVALAVVWRQSPNPNELASRFSRLALVVVVIVTVSGSVSAWLQIRSWSVVLETTYGQLLLVKLALVAVAVGLGYLNRRKLTKAVRGATAVVVAVRAEVVLSVLIIAVTSVLVQTPPAEAERSRPFSAQAMLADGSALVSMEPAKVGPNTLHLYFLEPSGMPRGVDAAELTVAPEGGEARRVGLIPVAPNHMSAIGAVFPHKGRWTLGITTVLRGTTAKANVEVVVR